MNTYEAMILLDNREVKKGWESLKAQVDGILTKHGAEIVVAKRWDERKLAYEIKKQKRATYYLSYFKADPQRVADISFDLKLAPPVLRHLILKVERIPDSAYEPEKDFDKGQAGTDAKAAGPGTTETSEAAQKAADRSDGESLGGAEQAESSGAEVEAGTVASPGTGTESAESAEAGTNRDGGTGSGEPAPAGEGPKKADS